MWQALHPPLSYLAKVSHKAVVLFQAPHLPLIAYMFAPTTTAWSQGVPANGNSLLAQAALPHMTPPAMSQPVPHTPVTTTGTSIPPETPLAAMRSVFPTFSSPVTLSLPLLQQHRVSASRHSSHPGGGTFAYNQSPGLPGPSAAIPSRKNKMSARPSSSNEPELPCELKCVIIPFCVRSIQSMLGCTHKYL